MTNTSQTALQPVLFLQIGRTRYEVASLKQASEMFCKARDAMVMNTVGGASCVPSPTIVDENGKAIGYVAYNGRVFAGTRKKWTSATPILFDNQAA